MNPFWSKLISSLWNELSKNKKTSSDIAVAVDSASNDIGFAQDFTQNKITKISRKGLDLICGFEGLELQAYDDGVGVCTIGYGTTIYPHGQPIRYGDRCTIEQAKDYMQHDLRKFESAVNQAVTITLTQNQFDALVSLSYNIGTGAFKNSTLLKLLNSGDYIAASHQFDVWIKAGGNTVQGLVNRRAVEKLYFSKK